MGFFNKIEDGSRTILLMAQESAGARRKFAIGGVALVVLLAGGGFGLSRYLNAKANEAVGTSWSALSRCMLGDPLAAGEKPSLRFRAIQLSAMTQAEVSRAPANGEPWPNRCAKHAHVLRESLIEASRAEKDQKDLAFWAEKLGIALKDDGSYMADLSEAVDQAWAQAAKAQLQQAAATDTPAPPAPAKALTVDSLAATPGLAKSAVEMKSVQAELNPGANLRILIEDKELPNSPAICTFNAGEQSARCEGLSADIGALGKGFRLWGSADDEADALVFSGKNGSDGVYRAESGDKIAAATTYGGYAAKDGVSALLTWDDASRQLRLVRKSVGKPAVVSPYLPDPKIRIGNPYYDSQLLWNQLVVRGVNRHNELWLAASELSDSGVGPMTEIGTLSEGGVAEKSGEEPPQLSGCRVAKALVARARGERSEFLSFFVQGRWTKPVTVPFVGGTLSCRKAEASITRVAPSSSDSALEGTISHARCTPAACQSETLKLEQFLKGELNLAPKVLLAAGDLDGKLLVVWGAAEVGGLRMRLAPADKIAKAPDIILYDDLVKQGQIQKTSTLSDARLFTRERFAILLLTTTSGTFALRIEPDGKYAPVKFDWQ